METKDSFIKRELKAARQSLKAALDMVEALEELGLETNCLIAGRTQAHAAATIFARLEGLAQASTLPQSAEEVVYLVGLKVPDCPTKLLGKQAARRWVTRVQDAELFPTRDAAKYFRDSWKEKRNGSAANTLPLIEHAVILTYSISRRPSGEGTLTEIPSEEK